MPVMPLADGYSEYFILRDQKTGAPLKNFPYSLSYGGRTFHDKTGDDGRTQRGWSIQSEELELTPHPERYQRQLLHASYWDAGGKLALDFPDNDREEP